MPDNKIVYIIGFMGSGKSTAGKKLASLLNWSFLDLDKRIEEYTELTITEIFSKHGEAYFRIVESSLLRKIDTVNHTVVSTGGGTPCFEDNMDYMIKSGLTVYLKLTPSQLKSRLADPSDDRPLLMNLSEEELLGFITEKLESREKWYNRSEIIVDGFNFDIKTLRSLITEKLKI